MVKIDENSSEFWELSYQVHRYLQNYSNAELEVRYKHLFKAEHYLKDWFDSRAPISVYKSPLYWKRKLFLIRAEYLLRGINPPPVELPKIASLNKAMRKAAQHKDIIVRFDEKRYAKGIYADGRLRVKLATEFADGKLNEARRDTEREKTRRQLGSTVRITTQDGNTIPIIGDLYRKSTYATGYNGYIWCASNSLDAYMFAEFSADACVVIHQPDSFVERLNTAVQKLLPRWYFHHNPIMYFDPSEPISTNEYKDAFMTKEIRYAYQKEYRYLWVPTLDQRVPADAYYDIELGSLADIAEYHEL